MITLRQEKKRACYLRDQFAILMYAHLRRLAFPENVREQNSQTYQKYRARRLMEQAAYLAANLVRCRAKVQECNRRRLRADPVFRLQRLVKDRIAKALFGAQRKCDKTIALLGCSADFYKGYLGSLFLPGMFWANRSLWHIDHIKPLASFDLSTESGQRAAFHFTNTQPLWAQDNLRKGARLV